MWITQPDAERRVTGRVQINRRQRCKLSGMRWTTRGAAAILTLRCLEASDRWEISPPESPQA